MQVVINIDDKIYEAILDGWWPDTLLSVRQLVAKGTILPKEHGRLIDADALRADSFCWDGEELLSVNSLIIAPTIIEAEKRRKNNEDNN